MLLRSETSNRYGLCIPLMDKPVSKWSQLWWVQGFEKRYGKGAFPSQIWQLREAYNCRHRICLRRGTRQEAEQSERCVCAHTCSKMHFVLFEFNFQRINYILRLPICFCQWVSSTDLLLLFWFVCIFICPFGCFEAESPHSEALARLVHCVAALLLRLKCWNYKLGHHFHL